MFARDFADCKKYGKVSVQQGCFRRLPVLWWCALCSCAKRLRGRMGMLPRGHAEPCPGLWPLLQGVCGGAKAASAC